MYYPSAKVIVKHPTDNNKILLVKRYVNDKVYYEPAGGKAEIDFNKKKAESLEECAIREAKEELGFNIKIEKYIGSYYFFWLIDPNKCSSCALFIGKIIDIDQKFKKNLDTCELKIEPIWVSINDILNKKIKIDSLYVGLEDLLFKYFNKEN